MRASTIPLLSALAIGLLTSDSFALNGPGDECANPIVAVGNAVINYNPIDYTASADPIFAPQCLPPGQVWFGNDMWVCWTPECDGLATITLCGTAVPGGTHLAIWAGCACPGNTHPLCCADDGCGGGPGTSYAAVTCEVNCRTPYLIRVSSDLPMNFPFQLNISCQGQPCPGGPTGDPRGPGDTCGTCCQAQPAVTGFSRPVALSTDYQFDFNGNAGDPNKIVLHVYEVGGPPAPPVVWNGVPRFEDPGWTLSKLGTIFGVTTDDVGNAYVAHSAIFFSNEVGSLGGGTGAVIKIDGGTAVPSLLVDLPNGGSGLGNLTWSCDHRNLYVTNFEDGRIYRVDPNAPAATRVKSAWDFATDTLTAGGAPEAGDPVGAAPKGERVWAVADGGDRLFFSVWNEDGAGGVGPNAIWSVATDAVGDPVPGSKTQEILINGPGMFQNPVADLAFDGECCLFAAQRTMFDLQTSAHQSDLLQFCWTKVAGGSVWLPGGTFLIGDLNAGGLEHSAAGGVGIDLGANGLVWASGDALAFGSAKFLGAVGYGIEGLPLSGGASPNAVVIDNDNNTQGQDKGQQGSVEVICQLGPSCDVEVDDITCVLGSDGYPNGEYSVVITITNNSGIAANLLLIPTLGQFVYLDPPLQSGQSKTIKIVVTGDPGDVVSVPIGLYDGTTNCCGVKAEFELPDCECALFTEVHVECISDGNPNTYEYNVTFTVNNISQSPAFTATWLFFIPPAAAPYNFMPTVKNVFPLTSPGQTVVGPVKLTFTSPPGANWTLDVPVSIHNANLAICCDAILHLEEPEPCPPSCSPDLNGDGVVNGADLALVLGQWGPSKGTCADLNSDGVVNGADLAILLGNWS